MQYRKGSFGFKHRITVPELGNLADKVLRVIVEREDGSTFTRTTTDGDVIIVDGPTGVIDLKIEDGDLTVEGSFRHQVIDETDAETKNKSAIGFFIVGQSLPDE